MSLGAVSKVRVMALRPDPVQGKRKVGIQIWKRSIPSVKRAFIAVVVASREVRKRYIRPKSGLKAGKYNLLCNTILSDFAFALWTGSVMPVGTIALEAK